MSNDNEVLEDHQLKIFFIFQIITPTLATRTPELRFDINKIEFWLCLDFLIK